jgi:fructose-1,6-bisphosphatase I
MPHHAKTFSKFIIDQLRGTSEHGADLAALLNDVQTACKFIAIAVSRGKLAEDIPTAPMPVNVQGEVQKPLDLISNEIMLSTCEYSGQLCGMVSEELEAPYHIPPGFPRGRYLLAFDPIDGSSGIDINMTIGTIFSILVAPEGTVDATEADFLQPGTSQVAAGYAIYGPVSMLVVTLGNGVHGFTLDREIGAYTLTHPDMRIPEKSCEFAINASNERFWEPPISRYVSECVAGKTGPREVDFNMRWIACMVAEVHRILIRGGLFMHPRDTRDTSKPGRLRLLYEGNPMAMLVEQAGGAASTARGRIMEVEPTHIHQRIPVILGSREEVERVVRYHEIHDRGERPEFDSPLFNTRSLFRVP